MNEKAYQLAKAEAAEASRLYRRVQALEAENARLWAACEVALELICNEWGPDGAEADQLRAALAAQPPAPADPPATL
jgi:hypothetical protein